MMKSKPILYSSVLLCVLLVAPSCSRFGGGGSDAAPAMVSETVSKETREAELRNLAGEYIRQTGGEEGRGQVIKRNPYYYKEYSLYPEGASNLTVDIQEKESRTVPYVGQVEVSKQRFATRLHRKRDEASADSNFLRDTGTETITFELRSQRWVRVGSLFVAERTEELVNGEWVPAQEEVERTVAEEETDGNWFQRAWSSITGR
ncbi:MAG: hypothetical protein AMXMBFR82_35300 [Candidatus Hydrogenedentota bacterium]